MEITNALLNDLGADPKVYSSEEKALMCEFADKIIAGELSSLLESCTLPEERLAKLRDHFSKNSDLLLADMKETAVCAEALATLYAQKSTVFVSSLSFEEKDDLIMSSLRITNKINDKMYVGKTEKTIEKRFKEHCQDRKKHPDRPLYRAMNKYGIENFSIHLLEQTDNPEEREEFWIKKLNTYHFGLFV